MATTQDKQRQEEILKDYEKKGDEIIGKMLQVLYHAQRKVDDTNYRNIIEKLDKQQI